MDCTGKTKRERICREYDVSAIGCIVLYNNRTVESDAGKKEIKDKYYKFLCVPKNGGKHEFIQCGYPTAKEICELSGIELPSEFNPFSTDGSDRKGTSRGASGETGRTKNRGRRQLYTAIMLFIIAKDNKLGPETPIFQVKERVENDMYSDVEMRDVKAVNTILGKFKTTMSQIVEQLKSYRAVRNFNFDILINMIDRLGNVPNNFR